MGKEGYDNNCSIIIYEQEELEKYLTCKLLRAKRAEFLGKKFTLVPLNLLYPFKLSVQKYTEQEFKDYQLKFQGRSPKFKDFSRTN